MMRMRIICTDGRSSCRCTKTFRCFINRSCSLLDDCAVVILILILRAVVCAVLIAFAAAAVVACVDVLLKRLSDDVSYAIHDT